MKLLSTATAMLLLLTPALEAAAAELDASGWYRARGRAFQSLSIDPDLDGYEGTSAWVEHRFLLSPRVLINEHLTVQADIKALDNVHWGNRTAAYFDPVDGTSIPTAFSDEMTSPVSDDDGTAPLLDITLWRAWGEVTFGDHRVRFGRVPLHWGLGVWQNDGEGLQAEYGDSADRVQWEGLFSGIYASLALDVNTAGFANQRDETVSVNGLAAWRTETVVAGLNLQYRRTFSPDATTDPFELFTADAAFDAELGMLEIHAEGVGRFGGGDLADTGLNDVRVIAAGGALDATAALDFADVGLTFAIATGDGNPNDNTLKTFTFDRDFNLGVVLFEEPMPVLEAGVPSEDNDGRSYDLTLTGEAVGNTLSFAPRIARTFGDAWRLKAGALASWAAKVPDTPAFEGRNYYGTEGQLGVSFVGMDRLDTGLTGAVFVPGRYFTRFGGLGISGPVFGARLTARIRF